ncbi:MAG TPA: tetratricopeptide repeat protein [Ktedonobacteraceae bacterium]
MPEQKHFFQRFRVDDPLALARRVEQLTDELDVTRVKHDQYEQLDLMSRLGTNLTILGREDEAAPLLEQALAMAREQGNQRLEVAVLLHLATAIQYLGQCDQAQELFQEALAKARDYNQLSYEDFILHHQGRCFVEQGKRAEARTCFEQALQLRRQKGEQRGIASTQNALDALNELEQFHSSESDAG